MRFSGAAIVADTGDKTNVRLDVAEMLDHVGSRREVRVETPLGSLAAGLVSVPDDRPVNADLTLESITAGIVVHGDASVEWRADCARCLEPFDGRSDVSVDELFESSPIEGETYPIEGTEIDLEPMLRDLLVVDFPLAPAPELDSAQRCSLCGRSAEELAYRTERDETDPRWDALRSLDL